MNVPLTITWPRPLEDTAGQFEPLTFGVPLPRGAMPSEMPMSLIVGQERHPVQIRITDRWADGSARWVLVDALVGRSAVASMAATLSEAGHVLHGPRVVTTEHPDGIEIDTGPLTVRFAKGGAFPISTVEGDGVPSFEPNRSGLHVTGQDGQMVRARTTAVVIEEQGPIRVCVRVSSTISINGGREALELEARVHCFAGLPTVQVLCLVRNPAAAKHPGNFWDLGDPGSVLLKDVSWRAALVGSDPTVAVSIAVEPGQPPIEGGTCELYQDSSGGTAWQSPNHINRNRVVPNRFQGYHLSVGDTQATGTRAEPVVSLAAATARVSLAVPQFWQEFPKAIRASGTSLDYGLFPGQYADLHELQGGEQKTHQWFAAFTEASPAAPSLAWCLRRASVAVDPDWVVKTDAVSFLATLPAEHRALVDSAIEGPDSFECKRELVDQYGWRHFGDIYGDHEAVKHQGPTPLVSHYNNQYDPIQGFGLQYLRTGDPRWLTAMNELSRHVTDIDIYHTDRDKSAYNGGLFWHTYHYGDADTSTHRTYPRRNTGTAHGGGPSADHNYPSGLMLHYFLTGDSQSREAAVGLARYVVNLEDWRLTPFRWLSRAQPCRSIFTMPDFFGPSRSSGNSLNALLDGHRLTGDPVFLAQADWTVRHVVHPKDDPIAFRLNEPEHRWFYTMFLQALGKYLRYKADLGQLDEAYAHGRASLLTYARWMARHEYHYLDQPEKLEHPTETWDAQDIRKSDVFCHAAIHASGDERDQFIERAEYFHRSSIERLAAKPTRTLARPVIVLLGSGFVWPWLAKHRTAELPSPVREPSWGAPVRLVSQRAQALQRAKRLVAGGVLVAVLVLVVVAYAVLSG